MAIDINPMMTALLLLLIGIIGFFSRSKIKAVDDKLKELEEEVERIKEDRAERIERQTEAMNKLEKDVLRELNSIYQLLIKLSK